jgi:hypothetical protein
VPVQRIQEGHSLSVREGEHERMQVQFEHFLLTRFNIRIPWTGVEPTEQWLRHRIKLFERYCYPSVISQTSQNFKWLIFFDDNSPDFLRERVKSYQRWPNLIPVFTDEFNSRISRQVLLRQLKPRTDCLVTSRLDNDDALCRSYIEMVQDRLECRRRYWMNFLKGYLLLEDRLLLVRKPSNQFISLVEPCGVQEEREIQTAFCGTAHEKASEVAPVVDVVTKPAWLWVYHGKNISPKYCSSRSDVEEDPKAGERLSEDFAVDLAVPLAGKELETL